MTASVYVALLHHPIRNRSGEKITTAVTNIDLHDLSRSCRTFGVKKMFVVTPVEDQHELVLRIKKHWEQGVQMDRHPDRSEALSLIELSWEFEEVLSWIEDRDGERPEVVMTDARDLMESVSYRDYRNELREVERTRPSLIVLGTGWGVDPAFAQMVTDRFLEPIEVDPVHSEDAYNHLSVRAAGAVILDRLFGKFES